MTPIQLYNQGVILYRNGQLHEAITVFGNCFRSGEYQPQSAYARILCQKELGLKIEWPSGMHDLTETIQTVYVASNLVGYLCEQGHQAILTQQGRTCQLEARINESIYVITIANIMGRFVNQTWRREGNKPLDLTDSCANPNPSATDRFIGKLVAKAASLPPALLPEFGLEGKLPPL